MYKTEFSKKAEKQFDKLEILTQKRVIAVLERMQIRPHHFAKKLQGTSYFSQRIGEHRIILDIQNKKLIVLVIEIDHRKRVYK